MLGKAFTQLVFLLVLTTVLALCLPWRSKATIHPGETRSFSESAEFIVPGSSADTYVKFDYLDPEVKQTLAQHLEQTGVFSSELPRQNAHTAIVPAEIKWETGSKNNRVEHTAPGARITLSGEMAGPAASGAAHVENLTWTAPWFTGAPGAGKGHSMEIKHGEMEWHGGSLLVNQWIAAGSGYWELCTKKAFYCSVSIALILFTIVMTYRLGARSAASKEPPGTTLPARFEGRYSGARVLYCIFGILAPMPTAIFSLIALFSNTGSHLEDHWGYALGAAGAYLLPLVLALIMRLKAVKTVTVAEQGMEIDRGDGWGERITIPWVQMEGIKFEERTYKGQISKYLRLRWKAGDKTRKFTVTNNSTWWYEQMAALVSGQLREQNPGALPV